jgi:hypothetical protein
MIKTLSGEPVRVPLLMVYPNYFATIGMSLVAGRDFGPADLAGQAPAVCIVNESFVRQVFGGGNVLGKPCYTGRRRREPGASPATPPVEEAYSIVGVVRDSRYSNPRGETRPVIYMTFLQTNTGRGQMVLHARVAGSLAPVIQQLREEVASLDPAMPMFDLHTLHEEMGAALVQERLVAMLASLFGALALLLACVGLYGLLAFSLVQRTTELGIRMALGARRSDVVWLVVRDALLLVAIGVAVGAPAAFLVGRFASSRVAGLIFGLETTDPFVIGTAILILTAVATFAAYLPARRAARVDPMIALRAE